MTARIRRASSPDLSAAAQTLARAFSDYPWTRWSVPATDHGRRLEQLQAVYLGYALDHGLVLVDEDVTAVAAFLPPDAPDLSEDAQRRVAELHGDRLAVLLSADVPTPPPDAWTLATLGVEPGSRGAGLGSALLKAGVAEIARRDGAASIALETSDARNVRLYERHGFVPTARTVIPGGPIVYSMSRAPHLS